jgi:hypothetical protein
MFSVLKQKLVKKKKGGSKAQKVEEGADTPDEAPRLCTPKEMKYLLNIDY